MASLLGFGVLIIALSFLLRMKLFQPKWCGFLLLSVLIFRGLITFSRGGMIGPLIILLLLIVYFTFSNSKFRKTIRQQWLAVLILGLILYVVSLYTNNQTSGVLFERYAGIKDGETIELEKYSSGRSKILEIDFAIFLDNPLFGIGPGAGNYIREEYGYSGHVNAHIEYSRLLAEHGIFGIISLFILLFFPLREFLFRISFQHRYFLMVGVLFSLTFMLHSATRIALPMLLYGMGFILIVNNNTFASNNAVIKNKQNEKARGVVYQ
jgi:O-antigen ligase